MNEIPLPVGFKLGIKPFVLPLSLAQFKSIFLDDDSPYFVDKLQEKTGNKILYSAAAWNYEISIESPKERRVAFPETPVIAERYSR